MIQSKKNCNIEFDLIQLKLDIELLKFMLCEYLDNTIRKSPATEEYKNAVIQDIMNYQDGKIKPRDLYRIFRPNYTTIMQGQIRFVAMFERFKELIENIEELK